MYIYTYVYICVCAYIYTHMYMYTYTHTYSGLISFRMDWLELLAVQGTLKSLLQESSSKPQFKSINSSVLSFLYSLTLTSIHDYWKNHSFD